MKYKALVSFVGVVNMTKGEVKEIPDKAIAKDLMNAGYIVEIKDPAEKKSPAKKDK